VVCNHQSGWVNAHPVASGILLGGDTGIGQIIVEGCRILFNKKETVCVGIQNLISDNIPLLMFLQFFHLTAYISK